MKHLSSKHLQSLKNYYMLFYHLLRSAQPFNFTSSRGGEMSGVVFDRWFHVSNLSQLILQFQSSKYFTDIRKTQSHQGNVWSTENK